MLKPTAQKPVSGRSAILALAAQRVALPPLSTLNDSWQAQLSALLYGVFVEWQSVPGLTYCKVNRDGAVDVSGKYQRVSMAGC